MAVCCLLFRVMFGYCLCLNVLVDLDGCLIVAYGEHSW